MKNLNDVLENEIYIDVGDLTIRPLNEFQVWIEDDTGEGMAIEIKILEGYLLRCIQEHFNQ